MKLLLSIMISLMPAILYSMEWTKIPENVQTIFYQGMLASQTQAAKYTGTHGFIATTGEHVSAPTINFDVIQHACIGREIKEVAPEQKKLSSLNPRNWYSKTWNWLNRHFSKSLYGIQIQENPDSDITIAGHKIHITKINIGQERDVRNHMKKYAACAAEYPNSPKILFGVSRGALTTFCAHAKHDYKDVKLVILEGAPDHIPSVIANRPFHKQLEYHLMNMLHISEHKTDAPSAVDCAEQFPKDTPIAFITSKKDTDVPMENTLNIVEALWHAGHRKVHTLVLENSTHPRYMIDDAKDKETYLRFIHALYKKYKLPYIPEYADKGAHLIEPNTIDFLACSKTVL